MLHTFKTEKYTTLQIENGLKFINYLTTLVWNKNIRTYLFEKFKVVQCCQRFVNTFCTIDEAAEQNREIDHRFDRLMLHLYRVQIQSVSVFFFIFLTPIPIRSAILGLFPSNFVRLFIHFSSIPYFQNSYRYCRRKLTDYKVPMPTYWKQRYSNTMAPMKVKTANLRQATYAHSQIDRI